MITSIKLKNFRIFTDYEIKTPNQLVIFSGRNATGKTSILEAIYYTSTTKSHRTNNLDELIHYDSEYFQIDIKEGNKNYRSIYSKNTKSFLIDNNRYPKISQYIGNLSTVMFSPDDLELIKGSKSIRRRFINLELSLLDRSYINLLNIYNRLIKERNELLKSKVIDYKLLNVITEQIFPYIKEICNKRLSFINLLNKSLKNITKSLDMESIELRYNPSYLADVKKAFSDRLQYDTMTKATNVGPHRDDLEILIDNKPAYAYASEGQCRIIAVAIKLAIKEAIYLVKGIKPIMLLDDVFASLDNKRILNLVKYIKEGYQTFISTTSIMEIPDELLKDALVIRLQK